jgi:hypothetical protein
MQANGDYLPENEHPNVAFPIEVQWNPSIVTYPSGKTYATSGDKIIRVPTGTTLVDLPRWVKWVPFEDKSTKIRVKGSRGNYYTVTHDSSKQDYSCTCPAHKFRGKCKHVKVAFPESSTAISS